MTTLLILSVGSLVGTNILDAVEGMRPRLRVVGLNSEVEAPNNFRCDQVYLAPQAREAEAYWRCVETVLQRENPAAVLAGRDDDIPLMAQWREQHPQWGSRFVVGASALTLPLTDKLAGHDWAVAHGLPFVPTVAASDPRAFEQGQDWMERWDCALIAKPRAGNGSRGVRVLLDAASLRATLGDADLVIQPYLADAAPYRTLRDRSVNGMPLFWTPTLTQFVAQTVIGPDGSILGRFDMEAHMVAGRCERATAVHGAELRDIGDRYAVALANAGWRGPVNAQMVRHPTLGFQPFEFCARVAGGMFPRTLLGFDEMALTLSAWTGSAMSRNVPIASANLVVRVTRDVGLHDRDCTALRQTQSWTRSS